jgi:hypothetical protein
VLPDTISFYYHSLESLHKFYNFHFVLCHAFALKFLYTLTTKLLVHFRFIFLFAFDTFFVSLPFLDDEDVVERRGPDGTVGRDLLIT